MATEWFARNDRPPEPGNGELPESGIESKIRITHRLNFPVRTQVLQIIHSAKVQLNKIATIVIALATVLACNAGTSPNDTRDQQSAFPTPDRSRVQVIDPDIPPGLEDPAAIAAYQQGYSNMKAAAWFSAIADYDEAIRIQPEVAGLYEARGTAHMYSGRHGQALADYSSAIELEPDDAGHWRRRAHAYTIAPTPQPHKGIEDANRAIELDPHHPMGYGHRAIALTQLPTPDWQRALADMNRHIELFPGHDPEAYRMRAWIHEKLGNDREADRDRRLAQ